MATITSLYYYYNSPRVITFSLHILVCLNDNIQSTFPSSRRFCTLFCRSCCTLFATERNSKTFALIYRSVASSRRRRRGAGRPPHYQCYNWQSVFLCARPSVLLRLHSTANSFSCVCRCRLILAASCVPHFLMASRAARSAGWLAIPTIFARLFVAFCSSRIAWCGRRCRRPYRRRRQAFRRPLLDCCGCAATAWATTMRMA